MPFSGLLHSLTLVFPTFFSGTPKGCIACPLTLTTLYRVPVVDNVKLVIKLGGGKLGMSMCAKGVLDNLYQVSRR
jgi:hypothetical protein